MIGTEFNLEGIIPITQICRRHAMEPLHFAQAAAGKSTRVKRHGTPANESIGIACFCLFTFLWFCLFRCARLFFFRLEQNEIAKKMPRAFFPRRFPGQGRNCLN